MFFKKKIFLQKPFLGVLSFYEILQSSLLNSIHIFVSLKTIPSLPIKFESCDWSAVVMLLE